MVVLINYYTNLYNSSSANIIWPHPLLICWLFFSSSIFCNLVVRELMKKPMWKILLLYDPHLGQTYASFPPLVSITPASERALPEKCPCPVR